MIIFFLNLAAGFLVFGAGFVFGIRYGVQQEEGRWRSMDSITWTDPIDVYIPITRYAIPYDHEERGDLA